MSESNKCRVCGRGVLVPFCWKCHDTRAADCALFEKSDRGELTAGELPVGATFKVTSWRKFGLTHSMQVLEKGAADDLVAVRAEGLTSGIQHIEADSAVTLVGLPKPESAPAKPELVAPPDSELPTYDEVMGALGSDWGVMTEDWRCVITQDAPVLDRVRYYPGAWLGTRGKDLPYLNLQRDDGQRVRFEVPGTWDHGETLLKQDTVGMLTMVANDRRSLADIGVAVDNHYARHVRWLPMPESGANEVLTGNNINLLPLPAKLKEFQTFSNGKLLPPPPTLQDMINTMENMKGYAMPPPDKRAKSLANEAFRGAVSRALPRPDFDDMLRASVGHMLSERNAEMQRNWLSGHVVLGVDLAADEDVGGVSIEFSYPGEAESPKAPIERLRPRVPCRTCKMPCAGPSGQCLGCRWRNVPADQVPRLERLLAEQVASGGQDCDASRNLLVRREQLIAEERERVEHRAKREIAYYGSARHDMDEKGQQSLTRGIAALRLKKPLIAYKRRGR